MSTITYIIYKPYNMLSQFRREIPTHKTLADLNFTFPKDVYPVGRLDSDSEGLLLLTNDKKINKWLLHPSRKQPKTYWAQVEGQPKVSDLQLLEKGVEIRVKGKIYQTAPAKVASLSAIPSLPKRQPPIRFRKNIPTTWIRLTLIEGKNRQVRRMCAKIGYPVLRLVRVGLAGFFYNKKELKDLDIGEVRKVIVTT